MINRVNIDGYALALLDLARDNNQVSEYKNNALLILDSFETNHQYLKIFTSYTITEQEKNSLFEAAFKDKIDLIFLHFIFVLIKRRKINSIINILNLFLKKINQWEKLFYGVVYSTIPLKKMQIKTIEKKVFRKYGFNAVLKNELDQSLLAGIKIMVNDLIIDNSLAAQLDQLKTSILKKGGV